MGDAEVHDASFYEFVAEAIEQQRASDFSEQRGLQRRPYTPVQLIAPLCADRKPRADRFQPITCHDLSAHGFSFLTDDPPAGDELVIALGRRANVTHLAARVAHRTPFETPDGYTYLVGCQFTRRLDV